MKQRIFGTVAMIFALTLAGCQPSSSDQAEQLIEQNKKILAKLKKIEDDMKTAKAAPAARRPQAPQEDPNKVYDIDLANAPIKGKAEAKVTLVEYSDFQCPYCSRVNPLIKSLMDKYPNDLKVAFKHFPLSFHQAARPAAAASMAAQAQGKFWEMHDAIFANQSALNAANFDDMATKAGLDLAKFKSDLEANRAKYDEAISSDFKQGQAVGVRGTPTLYLNGKKVQNRSVEGISAMIESALKGDSDS